MKFKLLAVSCSFAIALLSACTDKTETTSTDSVKIEAEIRPEINYVTHLYTLAGLGFNDEAYGAAYGATLPQSEIDTLRQYRDLLVFGQGEGGYLAGPFFFGISGGHFANADSLQLAMNSLMEEGRKMNAPEEMMQAAKSIADVMVGNYDNYLTEVYPKVASEMAARKEMLNKELADNSFVEDWQRVTGYTWDKGDYHWLLYRAGVDGPSYNNLDANTNTVYYNQSLDYQLSMFSHEFGIFLMMDSINPVFEEMKEYTRSLPTERDLTFVPWSAFESLSCWYNCKIAGHETIDYQNFGEADAERFCAIYDSLENSGITTPVALYRNGVTAYIAE